MIAGQHEPGFEPLAHALERVIDTTGGGAALCLYHRGQPVFDMWGGVRDAEETPWERDTSCVSFSTTKGVASTALHILVDRGEVAYDAPVARYWPEFAQNGKGRITVAQLMTHQAGLHDVRSLVVHADTLLDWDATVATLARASAEVGGRHAYHALTYGHLVGEIVRRVSGVGFADFVRKEIAEPLGLEDFWIGAPPEAIARAARLLRPQRKAAAASEHESVARAHTRRIRRQRRSTLIRHAMRLAGIDAERMRGALEPRGIGSWDMSSPRVLAASIPSVNGLFGARDLARMYACLAQGGELDGVRLMSERTVRRATRLQSLRRDSVLAVPMGWRLGYHSVATTTGVPRRAFGHYGWGGSGAWGDPSQPMSFAFTVNIGSGTPVGDGRIFRLSGVALSCVRQRQRAA